MRWNEFCFKSFEAHGRHFARIHVSAIKFPSASRHPVEPLLQMICRHNENPNIINFGVRHIIG